MYPILFLLQHFHKLITRESDWNLNQLPKKEEVLNSVGMFFFYVDMYTDYAKAYGPNCEILVLFDTDYLIFDPIKKCFRN